MRKLFSLFALLTLSAGMWAMNGVKYINANGQEQTVNDVTEITNTSSTLDAGWYIVKGSYVTSGQLICQGSVHLILADGAKLTATGAFNQAGIEVSGTGNSLTIYGQAAQTGQLFAFGGENGAGIGGGNHASCSDITINGGTVTATGGKHGAGIGGGNQGAGINITINGGTVTATGGADAAGIGGGLMDFGSHITINGGTVTATGGKNGAGIGGGNQGAGINITINGGTVTATGGEDAAGIGGGYDSFTLNIFVDADLIVRADNFNPPVTEIQPERTVKTDITGDLVGKRYVNIRPEPVAIPVAYINKNGEEQNVEAYLIDSINFPHTLPFVWGRHGKTTWYVVKEADMQILGGAFYYGDAHLILADGAKLTVRGDNNKAGIQVSGDGNSLTIYGQAAQTGQLFATGGERGAGIGGNDGCPGSNITIIGGMVTANGGKYGAGIGGGNGQNGSNISIYGGTVTATGGDCAAGIGGGSHASGSNITIKSGTVTATGGDLASGIGGGRDGSSKGVHIFHSLVACVGNSNPPTEEISITRTDETDISGSLAGKRYVEITEKRTRPTLADVSYIDENGENNTVKANTIVSSDALISWGKENTTSWYFVVNETDIQFAKGAVCIGDVRLIIGDGAKLTATGDDTDKTPGIQVSGEGNSLTIYGQWAQTGQLIANGGKWAAGIGGENFGNGSNITINGGTITATGGEQAAGIGGGNSGSGSNITINGGTVTAISGAGAAGIGGGKYAYGANIAIYGGTVTATGGDCAAGIGGGDAGNGSNITITGGTVTANGGENAAGIGCGCSGSCYDIHVPEYLIVKADNDNPPTNEVAPSHTIQTDIANDLEGKRYAIIKQRTEPIFTSVSYVDEEGAEKTTDAYVIFPSDTLVTLGEAGITSWYVVMSMDRVQLSKGAVCKGNVRIILADGAKLTATGAFNQAGIQVSGEGNSLTIYGQRAQSGQLIAKGGKNGAGIGGGNNQDGSNISIYGGIVSATGGESAAGIGGGSHASGSNISIYGGIVSATGGWDGAGIGGGSHASGSNITINGGTVTATGVSGSAGIGGGWKGTASNIFVDTALVVKADNNNPPTTVIANDGGDLTDSLKGKLYVTIEDPSDDTALPTLPYEGKVGKGSFKVMENGHFRIIREGKAYTIMGVEE